MIDFFFGVALSLHLGLEGEYQFFHPNLGVKYNNFMTGIYYNSENAISPYLGYQHNISKNMAIELGLVTGYSTSPILPMIKLNYNSFFISPSYEDYNGKRIGIVVGIEQRF